jgi:hypothetical protein
MRTDISIPRPISEAAEQTAHRLGISLSDLYTAALTTYVTTHRQHEVTELLNQVYEVEASNVEPVLVDLQVASLDGEAW